MDATRSDRARILIHKTGTTFEGTRRRFGDFDQWFLDAMRGCNARFEVFDITRETPPPPQDFDGMIVTGSPAGVYENPPWLGQLNWLLREVVARQRPASLCVCFGAQALAAALGGRVTPSPHGWEIGTIQVHRTAAGARDPLLGPLPATPTGEIGFQATHRDWIAEAPREAVILAENAVAPVQAFRIGERVWGTQFHPEATPEILDDLIRARREQLAADGDGADRRLRALLEGVSPTPAGPRLLATFVDRIREQAFGPCCL